MFLSTKNVSSYPHWLVFSIAVPQSLLPPSFASDSAKVALFKGESIDELIDAAGKDSVDAKRFRFVCCLKVM